ncbi:MAG: hypothetical protein RL020_1641 [Pseudomonadota bacterium]|jgi:hypothetical protein
MPLNQKNEEIAMLRSEIEIMMQDRANLLRVTGAAAAFVANLDSHDLPASSYVAAEILADSLNHVSEETLQEALLSVKAHVSLDVAERRTASRKKKT